MCLMIKKVVGILMHIRQSHATKYFMSSHDLYKCSYHVTKIIYTKLIIEMLKS